MQFLLYNGIRSRVTTRPLGDVPYLLLGDPSFSRYKWELKESLKAQAFRNAKVVVRGLFNSAD